MPQDTLDGLIRLLDLEAISTSGSRGLARGEIYTQPGALAASVMQEGLVRVRR